MGDERGRSCGVWRLRRIFLPDNIDLAKEGVPKSVIIFGPGDLEQQIPVRADHSLGI